MGGLKAWPFGLRPIRVVGEFWIGEEGLGRGRFHLASPAWLPEDWFRFCLLFFEMIQRPFFQQDPVVCARALVGCRLRWGACSGRVVETEAYDAVGDAACHTAFRPGARAFLRDHQAGAAYVYLNYGVHWMLNVLVKGEREGFVLIRALEPSSGLTVMRRARGVEEETQLCSGPGKLAQALGVTGSHHGVDLCADPQFGFSTAGAAGLVVATRRIGIVRAVERAWRFHLAGNPHVSGSRKQNQMEKKEAGRV